MQYGKKSRFTLEGDTLYDIGYIAEVRNRECAGNKGKLVLAAKFESFMNATICELAQLKVK